MSGLLAGLLGGEPVKDAVSAIGNAFDELITSDEERGQLDILKARLAQRPELARIALQQAEVQHRSVFVAGWRPFIGWVMGVAVAAFYIPQFLVAAILWIAMCFGEGRLLPYPVDSATLIEGLFAAGGLMGLRSFEKWKGLSK